SIPVIAVTAVAAVGDRERALGAGFDGYIPKPIDPAMFVGQVEGFLGPPRPTPGRTPSRATILAVDDLTVHLDFYSTLFEPFGLRVVATTDWREALRLAAFS